MVCTGQGEENVPLGTPSDSVLHAPVTSSLSGKYKLTVIDWRLSCGRVSDHLKGKSGRYLILMARRAVTFIMCE